MSNDNNNKFDFFETFINKSEASEHKFSPEDKVSWERFAETAFCALLQNPNFGGQLENDKLVDEAMRLADRFVRGAESRFGSEANGPSTGVYAIPTGRKAAS